VVRRVLGRVGRRRDLVAAKHDAQLCWWVEEWDAVIRGGGLHPPDALSFLEDDAIEPSYLGRRWQIARAQVVRVLAEAAIGDPEYFTGKFVVEVGPGPLGFPDACPARVSVGIDPLAERYAQADLLLPDSPALYIKARAEQMPLLSASADVLLARNTLDFVDDPARALAEFRRVVRPGGRVILLFDVGHTPTVSQPNALSADWARAQLAGMTIVHEHAWPEPFGRDGHRVVLVADVATITPEDER
jgi:SAM-dependent methyltransferase